MNLLNFFNVVLYVKLSPDRLTVREINSGYEISESPFIAITRDSKRNVVAFGSEAAAKESTYGVELLNPFKHPRALLSDFTLAELVVKYFVTKAAQQGQGGIFRPSPIIVMHPLVDPEGGFTQIEIRAMQELAMGCGARKVILWQGRELTNDELLKLKFESGGKVLN